MITTMVKYFERLEPLMNEKGMGVQQMADAIGMSYQGMKKVRDGGSLGKNNNIAAAKYFGVNSDWLATGKGEKYPTKGHVSLPALEQDLLDQFRRIKTERTQIEIIGYVKGKADEQSSINEANTSTEEKGQKIKKKIKSISDGSHPKIPVETNDLAIGRVQK